MGRNKYYVKEAYDECIIRNEADKVRVFVACFLVFRTDVSQEKRLFRNN